MNNQIIALATISFIIVLTFTVFLFISYRKLNSTTGSAENSDQDSGSAENSENSDQDSGSAENSDQDSGSAENSNLGVYMKDPREEQCGKCKVNVLKNEESNTLSNIETYRKNTVPLCFNHNDIEQKCCTIKEDTTIFGCPSFCFEDIQSNINILKENNTKDPEEYKRILRQNKYCNEI